ncbi:MAG: AAA family ATPase [Anaerolineae bacterium]|nr:AAA family ATPase [Anaerolineae bacterium]
MTQIIVVNAFRGGVGKSTITANLATLLAAQGRRVAVVDVDFQASGLNLHFGIDDAVIEHMLNDYLLGDCSAADVATDITERIDKSIKGRLFLLSSSMSLDAVKRIRREGYDLGMLNTGLRDLFDLLALDTMFIKTHHGLSDQILLSIASSDLFLIVMRPDAQDYVGTSVLVEAGRVLEVPRMMLIVNEVPLAYDPAQVKSEAERAYGCEVATVLPYCDEMAELTKGDGLFAIRHPHHPMTIALKQAVPHLVADR